MSASIAPFQPDPNSSSKHDQPDLASSSSMSRDEHQRPEALGRASGALAEESGSGLAAVRVVQVVRPRGWPGRLARQPRPVEQRGGEVGVSPQMLHAFRHPSPPRRTTRSPARHASVSHEL